MVSIYFIAHTFVFLLLLIGFVLKNNYMVISIIQINFKVYDNPNFNNINNHHIINALVTLRYTKYSIVNCIIEAEFHKFHIS